MHHKFIDQYSDGNSFLHKLDPRVKIIVFMALICCVVLTPAPYLPSLFLYGVLILSLLKISKLPWRFILLRSLIFLPFMVVVGLSVIAGRVNGRPDFFAAILMKSFLAVFCVILLVATTPFADLLKGFEKMRFPSLLLMVFSFMYRYLYLFSDHLMEMNRARESRTVSIQRWPRIKALSNMIGSLFIKSYETAEEVYLAMCSRGYDGQIRTVRPFVLKPRDYSFLAVVFVYVLGVSLWSFLHG